MCVCERAHARVCGVGVFVCVSGVGVFVWGCLYVRVCVCVCKMYDRERLAAQTYSDNIVSYIKRDTDYRLYVLYADAISSVGLKETKRNKSFYESNDLNT